MSEAVELGADLADLAEQHFLVAAAPVRLRVHERALGVDVELTGGRHGHRRREDVAELDDFAGADELDGLEHRVGPASASIVSKAVSISGKLVMICTGWRVSTLW